MLTDDDDLGCGGGVREAVRLVLTAWAIGLLIAAAGCGLAWLGAQATELVAGALAR